MKEQKKNPVRKISLYWKIKLIYGKENDIISDFKSRMTKKLHILSNEQGFEKKNKEKGGYGFLREVS